ncbi:progestin and adipoQ receptor family member VII, a [Electrophorus electricus]|uniref:Progestin and adipoQ receptor family member VII, a n=1 Tax=Electrophorus electricus TaxID=8005 RepID=A0A4W4EZJ6_ELEEL|nr:progestin and adipoQ receptor family member VII, a [Electrophorus electricus]XP_026876499.2 progestin and adipoQ receptor family member VII, a [Electrophorus electricus]
METIGRIFINLQPVRKVPQLLREAVPSMPATLCDTEVPQFFREPYINAGYRPLHQSWCYYFLSLFQRHNETINVWTHLFGTLVALTRMVQLAEMVDFLNDPHTWPLLILLLSSITYMTLSAIAHLLSAKSELHNYAFFFLDYIGVAQYQYGSAVVHFYYSIEESWYMRVRGIFMPVASFLCCLSCLGCCYGKYQNYSLPPWVRKVGQVVPSSVAYAWDTSPVFHRICLWFLSWEGDDSGNGRALASHCGQVFFFLSSAFFFTHPLPECLFPGHCDFLGQGHQVFHVLLMVCTFFQIHASYLDYINRREIYAKLHGDSDTLLFVVLYVITTVICAQIAACMIKKVSRLLECKEKTK